MMERDGDTLLLVLDFMKRNAFERFLSMQVDDIEAMKSIRREAEAAQSFYYTLKNLSLPKDLDPYNQA